MEDKLLAYRRQQKREAFFENIKIRLRNMIEPPRKDPEVKIPVDDVDEIPSSSDEELDEPKIVIQESKSDRQWRYCLYILSFIFWATCFAITIQLQFGAVFLCISALLGIYFNTRTGPKPKNEISAYSVFNKNVEAIDGTLNAEQFEREIRYGPTSVR